MIMPGRSSGLSSVAVDITNMRRVEKKFRLFKNLFDHSSDVMLGLDPEDGEDTGRQYHRRYHSRLQSRRTVVDERNADHRSGVRS